MAHEGHRPQVNSRFKRRTRHPPQRHLPGAETNVRSRVGSINHHQRAGGLADEGSAGSTIDTSRSHPSHARVIVSTAIRLAFESSWDSGSQKNESIGAQRNWPMATSPI